MEVSDQINLALVAVTIISFLLSAIAGTLSFFLSRQHANQLFHRTKFPDLYLEPYTSTEFAPSQNDFYRTSLQIMVKNMNTETMVQDLEGILHLEVKRRKQPRIRIIYGERLYKTVLAPTETTDFVNHHGLERTLQNKLGEAIISTRLPIGGEYYRYTLNEPIQALVMIKYRSGLIDSKCRMIELKFTLKPPVIDSANSTRTDWTIIKPVRKNRWSK